MMTKHQEHLEVVAFEKWAKELTADKPFSLTLCQNDSCKDKFPPLTLPDVYECGVGKLGGRGRKRL